MICSKCSHWDQPQIRVRMTPTFYHSPIFDSSHICEHPKPFRCNANYHSTVFDDNQSSSCCRNAKTNACCCKKPARPQSSQGNEQTVSRTGSQSKFRKQTDLNPHTHLSAQQLSAPKFSNHTLLWNNPDKEVMLRQCSSCYHHTLPTERKLISLSSCVFYPDEPQVRLRCSDCLKCNPVVQDGYDGSRQPVSWKQNKKFCSRCGDNCQCGPNCDCD